MLKWVSCVCGVWISGAFTIAHTSHVPQGPLKFIHSRIPKQTFKHVGSNLEMFSFILRDPDSLYPKGPIYHKWRHVCNLVMHACVQTIGDLLCLVQFC